MSAASPFSFWAIAAAGSVALHGALGMALYAMPMPEKKKPSYTEIDIATLAAGGAPQLATPENVSIIDAGQPALLVQPQASTLAAKEAGTAAEAVRAQPVEARAPETSPSEKAAPEAIVPPSLGGDVIAPKIDTAATPIPNAAEMTVAATETAPDTAENVQETEAATASDAAPVMPESPSDTTVAASPAETSESAAKSTRETVAVAGVEPAAPLLPTVSEAAPKASETIDAIASINPATPSIAANPTTETVETVSPIAPQVGTQPLSAHAEYAETPTSDALSVSNTIAPTAQAAPLAATNRVSEALKTATPAVPLVKTPPRSEQPVATSTGTPIVAVAPVATPSGGTATGAAGVASAIRPTESAAPLGSTGVAGVTNSPAVAPAATVVALLPRPDVLTDGEVTDGPTSGTLRVAEFLVTHKGDDCMLALPASISPTQASIQAYAVAPEMVARLGTEYERISGFTLEADTRTVSAAQCGALAFARNLAQYPNFPLRVTLDEPSIESGHDLSGIISGLRKDTLYLMVVDDDGKAELVGSYSGQRGPLMPFAAPMTLTDGPVSAVQLLVAIASDGPLKTIPTRPGMPAEQYFSKLATEIITGNRSIAYGITSFVVR
ncbi:hypothetical protein ACSBOB_29065 [Mesorhizobium sp. ASY16-5R]|uniref:hypothetical protein n=1 Tax=Mesorhizobium sp. ASY16-5R TaxID=3445772 RepID=UPI003FA1779F